VRREKVEIENALEQEQEFIVNKLRAELDRRQAQTRQLEEQIEQVFIWWALAVASRGPAPLLSINPNGSFCGTTYSLFLKGAHGFSSLIGASVLLYSGQ
jgi:hypothetical protein